MLARGANLGKIVCIALYYKALLNSRYLRYLYLKVMVMPFGSYTSKTLTQKPTDKPFTLSHTVLKKRKGHGS